ncbi:MAG: SdrD B-like domain-containing protein, partial [Saprospiraceae bacterium]
MRTPNYALINASLLALKRFAFVLLLVQVATLSVWSQCTPVSNTISGSIYEDTSNDGIINQSESGFAGVNVSIYDDSGSVVGTDITDTQGVFAFGNVTDGQSYRLEFTNSDGYESAFQGVDNASSIQFVDAPSCDVTYGLFEKTAVCSTNPTLVLTCFVQGEESGLNKNVETIITVEHDFTGVSTVSKLASHQETGSVWGVAHHAVSNTVYSSAFVKQYAGLKYGPYAILKTGVDNKQTALFVDVSTLMPANINLTGLSTTDISNCAYGDQVGRVGLGGLVISPDGDFLYTTLLDKGLVVKIAVNNPTAANTEIFSIAMPGNVDQGEEFRIFAITLHNDLIYIGGTVTASNSKSENTSEAVVYTLDPNNGTTNVIFRTNYIKGYWQDVDPSSLSTSHWLTDLAFTDNNEMILSLSDRLGHRYCKNSNNRVDQQFPDILIAGYDVNTQQWKLENNGQINGRNGTGVGNGEGPGGGEFFGFDHWPTDAEYHNETALGSVFALPGSGEIVASVYDPMTNSYSAGLHRYNTTTGDKVGAIELYTHSTSPQFGKATGFGDVTGMCQATQIEIGNLVWSDNNGNGIQDAGENGISDITLTIYNSNCDEIGSTTTDSNGNYSFNSNNTTGIFNNTNYYIDVASDVYNDDLGFYIIDINENVLCTANEGGASSDNVDCDVVLNSTNCFDTPAIVINTVGTNHTFDIGFGTPEGMDISLSKSMLGNCFVSIGDVKDFRITIKNQGGRVASAVEIAENIPDGFKFLVNENPNWDMQNGVLYQTLSGNLKPGASKSVLLKLEVIAGTSDDYKNTAEINKIFDLAGNESTDTDSTPNNQISNEDDIDEAEACIFDLAIKIAVDDDKLYFANDLVKYNIKLYNQGNVDADYIQLSNYFPEELVFNTTKNPGWTVDGNVAYYNEDTNLAAGETRDYCIFFDVEGIELPDVLVDYIEISNSSPVNDPRSFDFDSTPDDINDNDMGGEPEASTDNLVSDHGTIDEDDHDPAVIRTRYVDLALMKSVVKSRVSKGEDVEFMIEIYNQGSSAITSIDVVDYIPDGMTLNDNSWTLNDNIASKTIVLENPIYKGQSVKTYITLQVDQDVDPRTFVNYAEIDGATGTDNNEIAYRDIDSTPDSENGNDNGGVVDTNTDDTVTSDKSIDEDDHDPAKVVMISSNLENSICLNNASNSENGQYKDDFKVIAPSNKTWYVFESTNYFEESSGAPPTVPILINNDPSETLDEMPMGNGMSMYTYSAIRIDGFNGYISFRNENDEIEVVNVPSENYYDIVLSGMQSICITGVEDYNIINPVPGVTYTFSLPDGGVGTPINGGTGVQVDWAGLSSGADYEITVQANSGCYAPGSLEVGIGNAGGAMSCLGNINISLDSDCSVEIKPSLILTSDMVDGAAYAVMLTTQSGEVIPNAVLTGAHIGTTVVAKVIESCSGNSCWTQILVEDKLKPVIDCQDAIIACNKVSEFSGPFAQDNCGGVVEVVMLSDDISTLDCDPLYSAEISRSYQATDQYGNKSDICKMKIKVERVKLNDIVFPDSLLMSKGTALTCSGFDTIPDGNPTLAVSGIPLYNNEEVIPDFNILCNTAITFKDKVRVILGRTRIERTFTAWEWHCGGTTTLEYVQVIEILDAEPPVITCPDNITINANQVNCEGVVLLPNATIVDQCTNDVSLTITPPFGPLIMDGDSKIVNLPFRVKPYEFIYTATDASQNSASCVITVTVLDNQAPVALCDMNTSVSLNGDGIGYLYAMNVDDGSYDACGKDSLSIKRSNSNDPFSDKVFFDCNDAGDTVLVDLKIVDAGGLSNTCTAQVVVQDKFAPEVTAPANVTIECGSNYLPLSQFGSFSYTDACTVFTSESFTPNINDCGVGTILRTFIASDSSLSNTKFQTIKIENTNPFLEASITWPIDFDTVVNTCDLGVMFDPTNLDPAFAVPTYTADACDNVSHTYSETPYTLVDAPSDVCMKIIRNWKVIDKCQTDINGDYVEFTHTQIIKIINEKEPVISSSVV